MLPKIECSKDIRITAYIAERWYDWLAQLLYPNAKIIRANPLTDTPENVFTRVEGKICFFHLACTYPNFFKVEEIRKKLESEGVTVINGHVSDNSKDFLKKILDGSSLNNSFTDENGDGSSSVIVKSNFNNFAGRDNELKILHPDWNVPTPSATQMMYQVKKRHEVQDYMWGHKDYCIQNYVNNEDCVTFRAIYHLGRVVVFMNRTPKIAIKKWSRNEERYFKPTSETEEVFKITHEIAKLSKFNFFTIDVVMDNHRKMYVVDLNTTPSWTPHIAYPQDIIHHLRGEIV